MNAMYTTGASCATSLPTSPLYRPLHVLLVLRGQWFGVMDYSHATRTEVHQPPTLPELSLALPKGIIGFPSAEDLSAAVGDVCKGSWREHYT